MKKMESESIDMILTSPPYDNLRTYNGSLNWSFEIFQEIAKECARVIKK
jgi:DNA modification methylase